MAKCSKCEREVGCACNLIDNKCMKCYSDFASRNGLSIEVDLKKSKKRKLEKIQEEKSAVESPLKQILQTKGISREEKLRRINEIIENSRK